MADSDDEYDRRRGRDKFRRERNDYADRSAVNRREDWPERPESGSTWNAGMRDRNPPRRDYRDNYPPRMNHRIDRYSPGDRSGDLSPPSKRMRSRDWDDRYPNYELGSGGGGGGYHGSSHHSHYRDNWSHDRDKDDEVYQPPMMTLKQFINEQDDHCDEELLITKYNEYKTEFRKTQIQEFFNRHKDEEWFRCKYFPDEIEKRKEKQSQVYQRRLDAFMQLYESKLLENISLDVDKADQIVRVLDSAVIKLEGGTDFDLLALDENPDEQKNKDSLFAIDSSTAQKATPEMVPVASSTELQSTEEPKAEEGAKEEMETNEAENQNSVEPMETTTAAEPASAVESISAPAAKENEDSGDGELMDDGDDGTKKTTEAKLEPNKPRALHKTCSIFFRNLSPAITRQEIEDECRKFNGFLRLAISEPQMDRRFNRRGWATFERTVTIRDICWNLNSVKIRGCEISPIVNRDLTRRIRSVNGISSHKSIVRADIRLAAKLIMKFDADKNLWQEEGGENGANNSNGSHPIPSRNPLMKNIADYLIEEASAEEEELLGVTVDSDPLLNPKSEDGDANGSSSGAAADGTPMERDEDLIKFLDTLLLYLRIVHSFDYYSHTEYHNEDEMPNRIGLIHARGLVSSARVSPTEISDYLKEMENKITPLLQATPVITQEEARKLGLKDIEVAVEAFIKENTKDLGEGKWLCPLSNKKFMGPEYVRKHILNKHLERVEQVRAETHYFNNYILDAKRPQLPEHPLNRPPAPGSRPELGHGQGLLGAGPIYTPAYAHSRGMMGLMPGPYPNRYAVLPPELYNRNPMKRSRYRDLDAPPED